MAILHELGVKLRDQGKDGVHVLDSIIQGNEGLPILYIFVLGVLGVGLLGLHVLNQLH